MAVRVMSIHNSSSIVSAIVLAFSRKKRSLTRILLYRVPTFGTVPMMRGPATPEILSTSPSVAAFSITWIGD